MELGLYILLTFFALVGADVSVSVYKLSIVCHKEGLLVEALHRYVTDTLGNHSLVDDTVGRFLENAKDKRSRITDKTEWVDHPINAFHLVDRTANGWTKIKQSINCSTCDPTDAAQEFLTLWSTIVEADDIWPSSQDVNISATALWRLQETYELDIKTLMSGNIFNRSTFPLTSTDVVTIARYLGIDNQIDWYEGFLDLVEGDERDVISYKLAMAYYTDDFPWRALDILTELQKSGSRSASDRMLKIIKQKAESYGKDRPRKKMTSFYSNTEKVYARLCRGDIQSNRNTTLRCYKRQSQIPYYLVKEEVLSDVPRISLFHDVISDEEILEIQNISKTMLEPSEVIGGLRVPVRISETAWIKFKTPISIKISRRVGLITGFDTSLQNKTLTTERLQVVNYGLGGHYITHYDAIDKRKKKHPEKGLFGDRIATWMFYLSSVEAGGATVFPKLNLRVPPVKGSAVFWYNLLPSGELDVRSNHAACPVVLGSKWRSERVRHDSARGQHVRHLCPDKLNIDNVVIDRAHKFGEKRGGKPRPIVAKYSVHITNGEKSLGNW